MKATTFKKLKITETFDKALPELIKRFQIAKASGLLYSEKQGRSNTECSRCGEVDSAQTIFSICEDLASLENDPMSGDVYLFGSACLKRIGFKG